MDKILIKDLLARGIVGINPDERHEKQDILVNVTLGVDLRPAGASDAIADAVDYRAINKRLLTAIETSDFFLVEALAEHLTTLCLDDPRVQWVTLSVEKPSALRFARSVGVEITREKETGVRRQASGV